MSILRKFFTKRENFIYLLTALIPIAFVTWNSLLNNYTIEVANFTGKEIGILQSIREIPGFLTFTLVYVLLIFSQQTFAIIAIFLLGLGTALTGFFDTAINLYITTIIMSIGFHYIMPLLDSLSMQWVSKDESPHFFAKLTSIKQLSTFLTLIVGYLFLKVLNLDYEILYLLMGFIVCCASIWAYFLFDNFKDKVIQQHKIIIKKRYWLFYLLTFLRGARRQIFVVFAGFLLVEKFGMKIENMIVFLLISSFSTAYIAPKIGRAVKRFGEATILRIEYTGLIFVFTAYAFVDNMYIAMLLYIADHMLFSLSFAVKTYFHKIASPEDIASSTSISLTINHVAAVFLPFILGLIWLGNNSIVFMIGTAIACFSLLVSFWIPRHPQNGNESIFLNKKQR